jgi:hypothetical protein
LNDFKGLKTKIDHHLKELTNCSLVFDPETNLLPSDEAKLRHLLVDHTDKDILYHWDTRAEQNVGNKQYELTVDEQRRLFRLRNLFIRFLDMCLAGKWIIDSSEEDANEQQSKKTPLQSESIKKSLLEFNFEFNYELEDGTNKSKEDNMIGNLEEENLDSKLKIYVTKSFYLKRWTQLSLNRLVSLFVSLGSDICAENVLEFLTQDQKNNQSSLVKYRDEFRNITDSVTARFSTIMQLFDEKNFKIDGLNRIIECFSASLEAISFVIIVLTLGLSHRDLKPLWSEKLKKSKKKKGLYLQYGSSIDILFEIFENLCHLVNYLGNQQLKQIACANVLNLTDSCVIKSLTNIENKQYVNDLAQSFSKSFEELRKLFNAKLAYLLKFSGSTIQLNNSLENLKL